jgi:hypothetical protein
MVVVSALNISAASFGKALRLRFLLYYNETGGGYPR